MQVGRQKRITHRNKLVGCVCFCCFEDFKGDDKRMWNRAMRRTKKHRDRVAQGGLTTLKLSMLYN